MPLSNYREMYIRLAISLLVELNYLLIILTYFNKIDQPKKMKLKPFSLLIGCEQIRDNRPFYSQEDGHFVSSNSFKVCLKIRFSKDFLFQSGITPLMMVGIR